MDLIVGFDGLHRSGKSTQISLLESRLNKSGIPYVISRGDGTRRGIGYSSSDSTSKWWRENWKYFNESSNREEDLYKLNLKFQRIGRESRVNYKRRLTLKMKSLNLTKGVMILDRKIFSRYLTMNSFFPDISFEDSIKSYNPKNEKAINPIYPNLLYILDAPKEILLERLKFSTPAGRDFCFKQKIILEHYSQFKELLEKVKEDNSIVVLDATKDPKEISNIIWDQISKRLEL